MLPSRPSRGFTLPESMLVVFIAACLLTLALPDLRDYRSFSRLEMAARVAANQMMKVRYLAATRNCRYRLRFRVAENAYDYTEDLNGNQQQDPGEFVSPRMYLPVPVRFDAEGVKGPPSQPTKPPGSPVTFTGHVMSAGPDGRWSSPGTVYFGDGSGPHSAVSVSMAGRMRVWWWDPETGSWK